MPSESHVPGLTSSLLDQALKRSEEEELLRKAEARLAFRVLFFGFPEMPLLDQALKKKQEEELLRQQK